MLKHYVPDATASTPSTTIVPQKTSGPIARTITFVAREMLLSEREIYGHWRSRRPSLGRHVAMWIAYRKHAKSDAVIARVIGRDRSTVTYALQKVESLRAADPVFCGWTDDLMARAP